MAKLALALCVLCGCYMAHFPVTVNVVEQATYKVLVAGSQGTAWAVSDHELITAGHVCETVEDNYVLVQGFRRLHAKSVIWDFGEDGAHDICVLRVESKLPYHLVIADHMPKVGDECKMLGYVYGQLTSGTGKYLGDLDGPDKHENDNVCSAPSDHGASGGPVFMPDGVWGVVVRARTDGGYIHDGAEGFVAIPLDKITHILKEADVDYDTTPHLPGRLEGNPGGLPVAPPRMIGDE